MFGVVLIAMFILLAPKKLGTVIQLGQLGLMVTLLTMTKLSEHITTPIWASRQVRQCHQV